MIDCKLCINKTCEKIHLHEIDICQKGISHFNDGIKIHKKKEHVTLRDVAANLRHELHKVLQYIISQADEIDGTLSAKEIDLNKPASRIIGATVILDNFIEMISGVYDFNPDTTPTTASSSSPINLYAAIKRFIDTYSLIKNNRRSKNILLSIQVPKEIQISRLPFIIEYLIAVLSDNIWKYAENDAAAKILSRNNGNGTLDLEFSNISQEIPANINIFERGYQLDKSSEGFGFGLFWAQKLCEYYNQRSSRQDDPLEIIHNQTPMRGKYLQTFTIKNISYEIKK